MGSSIHDLKQNSGELDSTFAKMDYTVNTQGLKQAYLVWKQQYIVVHNRCVTTGHLEKTAKRRAFLRRLTSITFLGSRM